MEVAHGNPVKSKLEGPWVVKWDTTNNQPMNIQKIFDEIGP